MTGQKTAAVLISASMGGSLTRPAAVAGSWYPGGADALAREVDRYLGGAGPAPKGDLRAIMAPHAGLMYSGPVAAHAYHAVADGDFDVVVLVGPSHFVGFDGVAVYERGAFDTPMGPIPIAERHAAAIAAASTRIRPYPRAHDREHSLEMQLPFLKRVLPEAAIVPLVMGYQERATILDLASALAGALADTRALLVASTDLSHYFDADRAATLDARVIDHACRFDPEGLLDEFEQYPEAERGRYVACGGGPAIAVMHAARALGATDGRVLNYANSGDVSGDKTAVVGYLAAAFGCFVSE